MADPPPAHHCKDCGLVFDSGKSLDVHLHYHKENLLSKWAQQQQSGEESNNNHVQQQKKNNRAPPVPTPDSSDNRYYQQNYLVAPQQSTEDPGFILGTGTGFPLITRTPTPNSSSSPSPHHHNSNNFRYHPYQQYHPAPSPDQQQHRNGLVSSSSPQQCDKCGFICESTVQLMEHNAVAHNNHVLDQQQQHHNMFQIKAEPSQAEILDLDSHKVHVYQPPQRPQANIEQDRSVSALMSWVNDNNKEQHRFHQQSGGLASPDCYGGAVSTTTLTPPEPDPITRHRGDNNSAYHPYEQQQQHLQQQQVNNQISSTQLPPAASTPQQGNGGGGGGKTKSTGNGGSWKSNEARRPKTYNCSACNKWFTSSGHLKRHYNTTLHKNAVKSSGVPDPASMPISVHHHPQKESSGGGFNQSQSSPPPEPTSPQPVEEPPPQPPPPPPPPLQPIPSSQHHLNHFNHFLPSPPNLMAGSSEVTGGLLLHTTPYTHHDLLLTQQQQAAISSPPPGGLFPPPPPPFSPQGSLHTSPTFTSPPQPNPNFQPPHVSTIGQPVITSNNTSGSNLVDIYRQLLTTTDTDNARPLPSFSQQFVNHFCVAACSCQQLQPRGGALFDAVFDDNIFYTQQRPAIKIEEEEIGEETSSPSTEFPTSTQQTSPTIFDSGMKFSTQTSPTIFNEEDTATSRLKFPTQSSPTMFNAEQDVTSRLKFSSQIFSGGDSASRVKFATAQSSPSTIFSGEETPRVIMKSEEEIKSEVDNASLYEMMMMNDESVATENSEDNSQVSSTIESSPPVRHQEIRKEEKLYRCEDCDKFFNKVCYLTQHNKSFHAGNKPYKCERCGKRFVAETERQVHLSKHAGDKPYKCEMCPKQFNHKTDLRRHMCLHTGDKPFTCEQCGKGFIRKDHMLKHCETHKRRRAAPNQSPHQAQVRKQLRMKLEQSGKLGVAAQPTAAPMAVMQMVM
ncbi:LOW QUALITY PROTEIN: uncharacterized protein LOC111057634 [Nilaparvata lugens]|uniref:LOW QUALITY PROTEIN: uncharacterized protein LOC111057634 n=1 Tax=Nilaparvata lugens TaxID=108931 RepID=UPI00193CC37D|nr:LOW QUALITY PROTEIN: uncharacterized protein LOC111057634 [Nilaparvata lugens]